MEREGFGGITQGGDSAPRERTLRGVDFSSDDLAL